MEFLKEVQAELRDINPERMGVLNQAAATPGSLYHHEPDKARKERMWLYRGKLDEKG